MPGIFPPVTINGRRYIDGGMKSPTNAELAAGHDRVLVVSVTAGMERAATMFPGVAERAQKRMDEEHGGITTKGGEVRMIIPDAGSQASFGTNLMDFKRRGEIADAGYRQGAAEAEGLRGWWV